MFELQHCARCGRRIPKGIKDQRYFCSGNCFRKFEKLYGDPRHYALGFFEAEYGKTMIAHRIKTDKDFADSLDFSNVRLGRQRHSDPFA